MSKDQEKNKSNLPSIRQAEPDKEDKVLARPVVIKLAQYREKELPSESVPGLLNKPKVQKDRPPETKDLLDRKQAASPKNKVPEAKGEDLEKRPKNQGQTHMKEIGKGKTGQGRTKMQKTTASQAKSLGKNFWLQVKSLPRFTYVFLLILILVTLFVTLPAFRIQEVEMQNVHFIPYDELFAATGLKENQHFLSGLGGSFGKLISGRYGEAEDRVMDRIPEVEQASINFSFPGKLIIRLEEKIEIGWLKMTDGFCTIDSKGKVVSIKKSKPEGLPVISGLNIVKAKLGQPVEVDQSDYLENAMYAMSALIEADIDLTTGDKLLGMVTKIEPTIKNDIYLSLSCGKYDLKVVCDRSHDLVADFIWLKQMINSKVLEDKPSGLVDLRGKQRLFKKDIQNVTDRDQGLADPDRLLEGEDYPGQGYQGQDYQGQNYQEQDYQGQDYQGQNYQEQDYQEQDYQEQGYQGGDSP